MGKFREWLREAEGKEIVNEETVKEETEYQKFFAKISISRSSAYSR